MTFALTGMHIEHRRNESKKFGANLQPYNNWFCIASYLPYIPYTNTYYLISVLINRNSFTKKLLSPNCQQRTHTTARMYLAGKRFVVDICNHIVICERPTYYNGWTFGNTVHYDDFEKQITTHFICIQTHSGGKMISLTFNNMVILLMVIDASDNDTLPSHFVCVNRF